MSHQSRQKSKSRKKCCGNCVWWWPFSASTGECGHPVTRMVNVLARNEHCPLAVGTACVSRTSGVHCPTFERK